MTTAMTVMVSASPSAQPGVSYLSQIARGNRPDVPGVKVTLAWVAVPLLVTSPSGAPVPAAASDPGGSTDRTSSVTYEACEVTRPVNRTA